MQVCTSLQTDNHASTPPLSFLQAGYPSCHPTNSVNRAQDKPCSVTAVRARRMSNRLPGAAVGADLWRGLDVVAAAAAAAPALSSSSTSSSLLLLELSPPTCAHQHGCQQGSSRQWTSTLMPKSHAWTPNFWHVWHPMYAEK